jgi:hypothetical protein
MLPAKSTQLSGARGVVAVGSATLPHYAFGQSPQTHLIQLRNVSKTYAVGEVKVQALLAVSLNIDCAEYIALMGVRLSGGRGEPELVARTNPRRPRDFSDAL